MQSAHVLIEGGTRCIDGSTLTSDTDSISKTSAGNANGGIPYARKVRITANGNIKLTTHGGDVRTYTGVTAGLIIDWIIVAQVWSTGTTATWEAIY